MTNVVDDAELIIAARSGDTEAYAALYDRHRVPAMRFARSLAGPSNDAEDLVADGFARVLAALRSGNGPVEAFRPYLLSAVRNAFYDHARRAARELPVNELRPLAPAVPFVDPVMAQDERRLVATAFGELPERWQVVLWHTEVEGEKPAEVAPLLGISANAVAALAYRAREGLRERYLRAHLGSTTDESCRPTIERLAAYARRKVSSPESAKIQGHLDGCGRCRLLFVELADINSRLGTLLGPVVLGGAAAGYLAAGHLAGGAAGAGAVAGGAGVLSAVARLAHRPEALIGGSGAVAGTIAVVLSLGTHPAPLPVEPGSPIAPAAPTAPPPTEAAATPLALPEGTTPPGRTTGGVKLTATLNPIGSLVRGRPGLLLLTITNPTPPAGGASVAVTAAFSLPAGVTLRVENAGHGWTCASNGSVTCRRPDLRAGQMTEAHVQLTVAATAADGVPSVRLSGPGIRPVTAVASHGVITHAPQGLDGDQSSGPGGSCGQLCADLPPPCLGCTAAGGDTTAGVCVDKDDAWAAPFVDPERLLGADEREEDCLADPEAG